MQVCQSIEDIRVALDNKRSHGHSIGFVPTMGNLHAGHIRLVEMAKQRCDSVVVSIFVNPLQFGANEDLDKYPRTLKEDKKKLVDAGANLLFLPTGDEIYPEGLEPHAKVTVPNLTSPLCGANRPGHFTGVTTVVAKLFNITQPDVAFFGEKDFQQLAVIRKMAMDLCMPLKIIGVPTMREDDGLAMSSRNGFLSKANREQAPHIYASLKNTKQLLVNGDRDFSTICAKAGEALTKVGFELDYFDIRRSDDLELASAKDSHLVIAVAAKLGSTRLIDNITVKL